MKIGGIIDISTKDIPNRASMVIFTVGCNFKCQFCHNKYLLDPNIGKIYKINELVKLIESNALVSGVSITGGEPTLQNDLLELCKEVYNIGKYLSIDTNGSNPGIIQDILPYINRVALDLKGPLSIEKLEKITGVNLDLKNISKTLDVLNIQSEIDFEIRTTYVANLLTPEDLEDIINYLKEINFTGNFVLQQYQFLEGVGERFKEIFQKPEHDILVNLLKPYRHKGFAFQTFLRDEIIGYRNIKDFID
jgi:pyruvate formate lyase activating enzyme